VTAAEPPIDTTPDPMAGPQPAAEQPPAPDTTPDPDPVVAPPANGTAASEGSNDEPATPPGQPDADAVPPEANGTGLAALTDEAETETNAGTEQAADEVANR
jgi:hypothetical protein